MRSGPGRYQKYRINVNAVEGFPVFGESVDYRCKYCKSVVYDQVHRKACFFLKRPIDEEYIDPDCPFLKYGEEIDDENDLAD